MPVEKAKRKKERKKERKKRNVGSTDARVNIYRLENEHSGYLLKKYLHLYIFRIPSPS